MRAFRVTVCQRDEDIATAALWEAGTWGIEVQIAENDAVALIAYFSHDVTTASLRERLPFARVDETRVPDVDWVAGFRESFHPFRVGGFEVMPSWEPRSGPGLHLVVDPGRAFGTGTHETTRLCLGALETAAETRPLGRVLDLGAGTGILAVAAARLGARFVVAADLDPEAAVSSREHARLNQVRVRVVRGDATRPFRPGSFDLVVANLSAPLLVTLSAEIPTLLAPDGALVLAGLLESDRLEVQAAYTGCGRPTAWQQGEWAALLYGVGS